MPRTARIAPKNNIYHVLSRGNNKQDVFRTDDDFSKYVDILKICKEKHTFYLYHYVLMSNHVHLVMEPSPGGSELSEIMKVINLTYALYYQKKYAHIGHFWQDRFKSIVISCDEYLLVCGSYVELNPVRAGLVDNPEHYPWSSYGFNAFGRENLLLDQHPIVSGWSPGREKRCFQYREFVKGMMREKDSLRGEMNGKYIYGSVDFCEALSKQYLINPETKHRGRPRKDQDKKIEPSLF